MLYYCIRDVKANTAVDLLFAKGRSRLELERCYQLEKEVKFVITMQDIVVLNMTKSWLASV